MLPISGITGDTSVSGSAVENNATLGREDFLLLLVTQLSNQDPLNPMDGQEFAAQLAQFSSLEQLIGIGNTLADNGALNGLVAQSINSGVAAGLIDKEIEAEGSDVFVKEGEVSEISFELGDAASAISVVIKGEAGQVVQTVELGQRGKGEHEFKWDGKDADGNDVANGKYIIEINATDAAGNKVDAKSFMKGFVDRITFGPEGILVWIGQTSIPLGNIRSVGAPE